MPGRRFALIGLALLALAPTAAGADGPAVATAHLDGEINSVTAAYLANALHEAAANRDRALVVLINTPGGDMSAMDDIITTFLNSPVPVIAYVAPAGARADSAGLFVAQAADLVAMAPGTNIGSAHPIAGSGANIGGELETKVVNDAVATIRNLAIIHGRNADWAERAVRDSVNVGVAEAVRLHVADLEAKSLPALLQAVNGRTLQRPKGGPLVLRTAGATITDQPMSVVQEFLHALIDPNIAFVLLLLALAGLIMEVTTPGAVLPGTVGAISAVLALVALTNLPVNVAGVILVLIAFGLFLADIKAATHGVLTVGGMIALVLGGSLLVNVAPYGPGVDLWLPLLAAVALGALFVLFVGKVVQARRLRAYPGLADLVGGRGVARTDLDPYGEVAVGGVLWRAVSTLGAIRQGSAIRVVAQKGLELEVAPAEPAAPEEESAWAAS